MCAEAAGGIFDKLRQRRAGDEFHYYERLVLVVILDVEDGDEVGAFEVHALLDTAQLDLLVVLDDL